MAEPGADRRIDLPTRGRLEEIHASYRRYTRKTNTILLILALAQIGLGTLSVYLVGQNNKRSSEHVRVSEANRRTVAQIQAERERNSRNACESLNARNRNTKREIRRLVRDAPPRPGNRAEQRRNLAGTFLIIDRLAPVQNCDDVVAAQVGGSQPGGP